MARPPICARTPSAFLSCSLAASYSSCRVARIRYSGKPQHASGPKSSTGSHGRSPRRAEVARFLFVVPPLVGHTNPTVSVARALQARGHEVAWVAHPRAVRPLLPPSATLFELDDHVPAERWE